MSKRFLGIAALMALKANIMASVIDPRARSIALAGLPGYRSRGKGEGCPGNKHARSSFKQNKRRGL